MMTIRELHRQEELPLPLLLSADPDEAVVQSYINRSKIYVMEMKARTVAVYVLLPTRPGTVEIVNIAVDEQFQGQGIGTELIKHALQTARELGYAEIEIGTGNSSIGQLYLYQKCGFRIVGVESGHFVRHYREPIFENGLPCVDMIRLRQQL